MSDESKKEDEGLDNLLGEKEARESDPNTVWVGKKINRKQHGQLCAKLGVDSTSNGAKTWLAMLKYIVSH